MKRYIRGHENIVPDGTILYRSGSIDPAVILNSDRGVFFATSADYFNNHSKMSFTDKVNAYLLLPSANVWDPQADFTVYNSDSYDRIFCLLSDLACFDIEDESDVDMPDGYGITSTDGLAIAGKKLGYDATVIRNIWYHHGYYDEYAVYNPLVLREYK